MKHPVNETMSTDLIAIGWTEKMEVAFNRMRNNGVRHLPVRDEAGEIVGMLSDRDMQRAMLSTIEHGWASSTESVEFDPNARVRDYMNWPVIAVDASSDIRLVAERMVAEKVSSLLVKSGTRAVGIVTAEDLLKVLINLLSDPGTSERFQLSELIDRTSAKLAKSLI